MRWGSRYSDDLRILLFFMPEIGKGIKWVADKLLSVNRLQPKGQLKLQIRHITPIN